MMKQIALTKDLLGSVMTPVVCAAAGAPVVRLLGLSLVDLTEPFAFCAALGIGFLILFGFPMLCLGLIRPRSG